MNIAIEDQNKIEEQESTKQVQPSQESGAITADTSLAEELSTVNIKPPADATDLPQGASQETEVSLIQPTEVPPLAEIIPKAKPKSLTTDVKPPLRASQESALKKSAEIKKIIADIASTDKGKPFPFYVVGMGRLNTVLLQNNKTKAIEEYRLHEFNSGFFSLNFGVIEDGERRGIRDAYYARYILRQASGRGCVDTSNSIKTGVHKIGKTILLAGRTSYQLNNGALIDHTNPTLDSRLISSSDDWVNGATKKRGVASVFNELHEHIKSWNWSILGLHSKYITAFIMLAPLQFLLKWRPIVYIHGTASTGKSSLLSFIEELYLNLTRNFQKSTAHSIAQTLDSNSYIPILDEFEKSKKIPEVLELLKTAGAGGFKRSGTPGSTANSYKMKHLFFIGSIFIPQQVSTDQAIRSRTLGFELIKANKKISLPLPSKSLGGESMLAVVSVWGDIERIADELEEEYKQNEDAGIDSRLVDNTKYASALLKVCGEDIGDITQLKVEPDNKETDADSVLSCIINHVVEFVATDKSGKVFREKTSVRQYFQDSEDASTLPGEFDLEGLFIHKQLDKELYLALNMPLICERILKKSDYKDLNPLSILSRIEGAIPNRPTRKGSRVKKCLLIPMHKVSSLF